MENESMENKSTKEETVADNKEEITEKTNENNNEPKKKGFFSRMSTPKKIIFVIFVVLLLAVVAAGVTLLVFRGKGEASLRDMSNTMIDPMAMEESKQVYYEGKEYKYNDKLINILLIGNDSKLTVSQRRETKDSPTPSYADTLFLITINPENKSVDCISINRHTMAKIDYYMPGLGVLNNYETQVTRQYAQGTGLEGSCELTVKAVSKLLGNIPIHGYASISLDAIKPLNHVVGGVEVEVIEDIPGVVNNEISVADYKIGDSLMNIIGKKITLSDDQAYAYLRYRGAYVGDSDKRLDRQRQYLKALLKKIIDNTKKDFTFPMKVRDALSEWLVTDIDDNELFYLVSSLAFYKLNIDSVTHLPGTTKLGEDTAEQFYPDEDEMKKIIIERFYKPVG